MLCIFHLPFEKCRHTSFPVYGKVMWRINVQGYYFDSENSVMYLSKAKSLLYAFR